MMKDWFLTHVTSDMDYIQKMTTIKLDSLMVDKEKFDSYPIVTLYPNRQKRRNCLMRNRVYFNVREKNLSVQDYKTGLVTRTY